MHVGLIDFIEQPRQTDIAQTSLYLHFILDQALYPDLLKELTERQVSAFDYLLIGTDFASQANTGPVWISAQSDSTVANWCLQVCQHQHAGIVIAATDRERALKHARWLLKVYDGSGGQSWVTYYQPTLCAAMFSPIEPQAMALLMGPWSAVYAPSTNHIEGLLPGWLSWQTDHPSSIAATTLFTLSSRTEPAYSTLRWVYWIDEQHTAFNDPNVDQLPGLIDNLNLLQQYHIYESAHLLQLADLMVRTNLAAQPAAMSILRSADEAFDKVEQLLALKTA
jgi:hypothetical protein